MGEDKKRFHSYLRAPRERAIPANAVRTGLEELGGPFIYVRTIVSDYSYSCSCRPTRNGWIFRFRLSNFLSICPKKSLLPSLYIKLKFSPILQGEFQFSSALCEQAASGALDSIFEFNGSYLVNQMKREKIIKKKNSFTQGSLFNFTPFVSFLLRARE